MRINTVLCTILSFVNLYQIHKVTCIHDFNGTSSTETYRSNNGVSVDENDSSINSSEIPSTSTQELSYTIHTNPSESDSDSQLETDQEPVAHTSGSDPTIQPQPSNLSPSTHTPDLIQPISSNNVDNYTSITSSDINNDINSTTLNHTNSEKYKQLKTKIQPLSKFQLLDLIVLLVNKVKDLDTNYDFIPDLENYIKKFGNKLPVVLNIVEDFSDEFEIKYDSNYNIKTFIPKTGFLFKAVKKPRMMIWHTLSAKEYANKVEYDVKNNKLTVFRIDGEKEEMNIEPKKDVKVVEDGSSDQNKGNDILDDIDTISTQNNSVSSNEDDKIKVDIFNTENSFSIYKVVTDSIFSWKLLDDRFCRLYYIKNDEGKVILGVYFLKDDDNYQKPNLVTLDINNKAFNKYINYFKFQFFNIDNYVPQDPYIIERVKKGDIEIWKYNSDKYNGEYPTSICHIIAMCKVYINFDKFYLTYTKNEVGEWVEISKTRFVLYPIIKIYTLDPNDSSKTIENDTSTYTFVHPNNSDLVLYQLKSDTLCTKITSDGITVWIYDPFKHNGKYPKNICILKNNWAIIDFGSKLDVYSLVGKNWIFNEWFTFKYDELDEENSVTILEKSDENFENFEDDDVVEESISTQDYDSDSDSDSKKAIDIDKYMNLIRDLNSELCKCRNYCDILEIKNLNLNDEFFKLGSDYKELDTRYYNLAVKYRELYERVNPPDMTYYSGFPDGWHFGDPDLMRKHSTQSVTSQGTSQSTCEGSESGTTVEDGGGSDGTTPASGGGSTQ